jgi:integrase
VVLTREEVKQILSHVAGDERLFFSLLYGTGIRLTEVLRLRVKDVDLIYAVVGFDQSAYPTDSRSHKQLGH